MVGFRLVKIKFDFHPLLKTDSALGAAGFEVTHVAGQHGLYLEIRDLKALLEQSSYEMLKLICLNSLGAYFVKFELKAKG